MIGEANSEDGWVVCRVFKKKNYHKAIMESSQNSLMDTGNHHHHHHLLPSKDGGILDRILVYMGRTTSSSSCKQENATHNSVLIDHHQAQAEDDNNPMHFLNNNNTNNSMMINSDAADLNFMHLPRLESPSNIFNQDCTSFGASSSGLSDWVALDRLVASQLNGHDHHQEEEAFCFPGLDHNNNNQRSIISRAHQQGELAEAAGGQQVYGGGSGEVDFWSFARTPSTSSSSDPLCHLSV